ncbi:hypothetical protein Glove_526g15 [Diversispora epigaea]|uniref:Uncharacterized protein n=1 Tax=Diversispora epigaea TaxID=1348612 RepID=A0A397GIL0_9GLOM|nr:hypothetical protein Glove_526g15 [Diversispora epigaea]
MDNGTDNGTDNVTDNVTDNITDNIMDNVMDNGTDNVTDNGTDNVTDNITDNIFFYNDFINIDMRSDAFPLSSVDYEYIMQYRDAKPKHKILKKLRKKYSMTNNLQNTELRPLEILPEKSNIMEGRKSQDHVLNKDTHMPISSISSETLHDESKIKCNLETLPFQNSASSHVVKNNFSIDNTTRRKTDLLRLLNVIEMNKSYVTSGN